MERLPNIPINRYIGDMVHVGKKHIEEDVRHRIERELIDFVLHPKKKISKSLVLELLTETERLMLAKRFAGLVLLTDDTSYYTIARMLGMSTSTCKLLHSKLLNNEFPEIEKYVSTKKENESKSRQLGKLLRGGLPPRTYIIKKRLKR